MMVRLLLASVSLILASGATAQNNFSCPYGTNGACLNYGDRVVNQTAACFDQFACGYKGFVCKSKLDDAIDEYNNFVNKYNGLRSDYNDVLSKNKALIEAASDLLEKNKLLVNELTTVRNERDDAMRQQQLSVQENERLTRELAEVRRRGSSVKPTSPERLKPQQGKGADKTT